MILKFLDRFKRLSMRNYIKKFFKPLSIFQHILIYIGNIVGLLAIYPFTKEFLSPFFILIYTGFYFTVTIAMHFLCRLANKC